MLGATRAIRNRCLNGSRTWCVSIPAWWMRPSSTSPIAHSGEAVVLFVVRKDASLAEDALRAHCEQHLAPYKRPRRIVFRDDLPRTNIGKVLRRRLRDELMKQTAC